MDGSTLRLEPSEPPQNLPVDDSGTMPDWACQSHEMDSLYALLLWYPQEGLAAFHPNGEPFKDPDAIFEERDQAQRERDQAQQERDRAFAKLRELGIEPTEL